jgi:catechol 2,3-dioxygenase-like lactoylglutathione lyase family enzyme
MDAILNGVAIYARDMHKTADFYRSFFGFLGQAAKSVKLGQVGVKLSFAVHDVEAFKLESERRGLKFGSTHLANGYSFANAKDPDQNSVSISSRAYRIVDAET